MRVVVLVDGEHYPSVTRWALDVARTRGHEVVAAVLAGGIEKIDPARPPDLGVPLIVAGGDLPAALSDAIGRFEPEGVLDLSDEPVLGYRERMQVAAVVLARGLVYLGADFRFDPPIHGPALDAPTLAVIGTGKRTGKTAIAGEIARTAVRMGLEPIVVAMGRGGPAEPQVAEAGTVNVGTLLELARTGRHAASDYLEDAVTTGVTTIGARRAGGGLAGAPYASNVRAAAEIAVARGAGLVILEGSGSAIPPVPWDAGVLVAPASVPEEYLDGYFGPYRRLLSDLVVFTMATGPIDGPEKPSASHLQHFRGDVRFLVTDFLPVPLADVRGTRVFFATTAPLQAAERQMRHLEAEHGCTIVGWSARLADRAGLAEDLDAAGGFDVLLTELKAAAVDVACERALIREAKVVFIDNRPVAVAEGDPLGPAFEEVIRRAQERGRQR